MSADDQQAFALRAEYDKDFAGATAASPDGSLIDIGDRLANNNGVIVTSDPDEIGVFAAHPALKAVPVPTTKKGGR